MFFSEGQSCPVCKKRFQKEDDVVVCPVCGAPHHRSCYNEIGHCYYEETHGTADQWSRENAKSNENTSKNVSGFSTKRCPHCGFDNPAFAEFCGHCGRPVEPDTVHNPSFSQNDAPFNGTFREFTFVPFRVPVQNTGGVDPDLPIDGERAADVAKVVGTNQAYYMPTFEQFEKNGKKIKWNWAAFFLTPLWLLYRKCYLTGFLMLVFSILQNTVNDYIFIHVLQLQNLSYADTYSALQSYSVPGHPMYRYVLVVVLLFMISLALSIFFGMFGNAIYEHSCLKKVRAHKDAIGSDPAALTMAGGVSLGLPIYALFFAQFVQFFLENLFMKL